VVRKVGQNLPIRARPYILMHDVSPTVATHSQSALQSEIGQVLGWEWDGMRRQEIGQTRAWAYPAE
jgi:hypothetical protein